MRSTCGRRFLGRLFRFWIICNLFVGAFLCISTAFAVDSKGPLSATVIAVEGQVRFTTDGQNWELLEKGEKLRPGALIQTGLTNAMIDLQLGEPRSLDGTAESSSRLRLFNNSILGMKKLRVDAAPEGRRKEIELDLRSGVMHGLVEPGSVDCEVEFPNGVVGIRASTNSTQRTSFILHASGALTVLSGQVVISLAEASPIARVVTADQQFDPASKEIRKVVAEAPERGLPLLR